MSLNKESAINIQHSINLELYDPKQFDISFSSSNKTDSLMDESFRSADTDNDLINELDIMASYINGIDNHLKYKDMILKTTAVSLGLPPTLFYLTLLDFYPIRIKFNQIDRKTHQIHKPQMKIVHKQVNSLFLQVQGRNLVQQMLEEEVRVKAILIQMGLAVRRIRIRQKGRVSI